MIRPTIRARVTAWYVGLALAGGLALIGGSFVIALRHIDSYPSRVDELAERMSGERPGARGRDFPTRAELERLGDRLAAERAARSRAEQEVRVETRRSLLLELGALLAAFALAAGAIGLFLSRRVLAPVKRITGAARAVGAGSLGQRLRLEGPDDELKELGNTFDEMLERVERAFERERAFIGNASHELRTPLAIMYAELDAARSGPAELTPEVSRSLEVIGAAAARSEELVESLLALARADRGVSERVRVNLADVAGHGLVEARDAIAARGVAVQRRLEDAWVVGDSTLLEQLAANLLDNAARYNRAGGQIAVATTSAHGEAVLRIESDGRPLRASDLDQLLEPFNRGNGTQPNAESGLGLGLAIVEAIARAHGGTVALSAREEGGLRVEVAFATADVRIAQPAPSE